MRLNVRPAAALLIASVTLAQLTTAQAQTANPPARFEAADVHPAAVSGVQVSRGPFQKGRRFDVRGATLVDLIVKAYGVTADKVVDGPTWLEYDRYDIAALTPPNTTDANARMMLQALLGERFGLVVRQDKRPLLAYVLTAPKGSQKLKESDGSSTPGCGLGISTGPREADGPPPKPVVNYTCRNTTLTAFAEGLGTAALLRDLLGNNPVQDKTGIEGSWDFNIKFPLPSGTAGDAGGFLDAAEKQAGLKFERDTLTLPVLVVEKANRIPSPNAADIAQKLPPPPAEFEVATLKPFEQGTGPTFMGIRVQPGGRVEISGLPLKQLLQQAWNIQQDLIIGAPKWLETDRYTILGKLPTAQGPAPAPNAPIDQDALFASVRALLTERFRIKTHFEERPLTAYTLTATKPKLKPADPSSRTKWSDSGGPIILLPGSAPSRTVRFQNISMAQFAEKLQFLAAAYIHSPVMDATGLQGGYDFSLSFSPIAATQLANLAVRSADSPESDTASDPIGGVSIFEAVEKQLGLKLIEQKRPVRVLVIDHIEQKPVDN